MAQQASVRVGGPRKIVHYPIEAENQYDLGQWLERKEAFGLIAGKTAAAEVECLRQTRDGNLFRAKTNDWAEFCLKYAGSPVRMPASKRTDLTYFVCRPLKWAFSHEEGQQSQRHTLKLRARLPFVIPIVPASPNVT